MYKLFKHCFKVLLLTLLLCTSSPSNASWNSVADYIDKVPWGPSYMKKLSMCNSGNSIISPLYYSKFFSVYLPESLPDTNVYTGRNLDNLLATTMVARASANYALYIATLASDTLLKTFIGGRAMAAIGSTLSFHIMQLTDVCTNTFIMQPHEYVNMKKGWVTIKNKKNVDPCAVTKHDVPYFFQCSHPSKYGYDRELCYGASTTGTGCNCSSSAGECSCSLPDGSTHTGTPPTFCLERPDDVGSIKVGYDGPMAVREVNGSGPYKPSKVYDFYPNDRSKRQSSTYLGAMLYSFFDISHINPNIKSCVVSVSTIPPVKVGCASVSPPKTDAAPLDAYFLDTRCAYAYYKRDDLASVATLLDARDNTGHSSASVSNFLRGSLHFTSTTVGCIKDIMLKVIAMPYSSASVGFLADVQNKLRSMVYAMLILYVTLVAIKIMSMTSSIKPAEYILFIVKFALVVYFVTPAAWYQLDGGGLVGGVSGLARSLIFGAEAFASVMIDALNASDPVGMCRYEMMDGSQLLTERMLYTSKDTYGYIGVKVSIWDFIDCKLVNYLNLGSCNYSFSGILSMWMIGMLISSFTIVPFGLAVLMIMYCVIMLKIVCKMVSMFVMSAVSIAVLIMVSPIFIGLSLFSFTKGMFDTWMKKLFGYMIYPAFLTAGFCLMIAVLDAVYNGTYGGASLVINTSSGVSEGKQIVNMCKGNDSVFCTTVNFTGPPCTSSAGAFAEAFSLSKKTVISKFTKSLAIIKPSVVSAYYSALFSLIIFSILFSTFFNVMISMAEFISGVAGLSSAHSSGVFNAGLSQIISFTKGKISSSARQGLKSYAKGGRKGGEEKGNKDKDSEDKEDKNKDSKDKKRD